MSSSRPAPRPPRRAGWLCGPVCQPPFVAFAGSSDHPAGSIVSPSLFGWSRDALFFPVPGSRKAFKGLVRWLHMPSLIVGLHRQKFLVTYLVLLDPRTRLCDRSSIDRLAPLERRAEFVWCACRPCRRALHSSQRSRP